MVLVKAKAVVVQTPLCRNVFLFFCIRSPIVCKFKVRISIWAGFMDNGTADGRNIILYIEKNSMLVMIA